MTEPKPVRGEDTKFGTLYVELNTYNTLREAWKFEREMKITAREQRDRLVHQLESAPVGVSPDLLTRIEQAINNPAPDDDGGTTGEEALQLLEQLYNAVTSSDQA